MKIDFIRTPDANNQRVKDGNLKVTSALAIPVFTGAATLNDNPSEPGYIGYKDGKITYFDGTSWITINSVPSGGSTSQYLRGDNTFQTLNTTAVAEGNNLYYTQARFDAGFSAKSTNNLSEGSNLYFTNQRVKDYSDTLYIRNSTVPEAKSFAISGTGRVDQQFSIGGEAGLNPSIGDPIHKLDITIDDAISKGGFQMTFYGNNTPTMHMRYAGGTPANPTNAIARSPLLTIGARGMGTTVMNGSSFGLQAYAVEDFSNTAAGTFAQIAVAPIGSIVRTKVWRFNNDGLFTSERLYLGTVSGTAFETFTNSGARVQAVGNISLPTYNGAGANLSFPAAIYFDTNGSGTIGSAYNNFFGQPTLTAANAVTYTVASNVTISGAPNASTNVTITNPYSLYVTAGLTRISGGIIFTGSQSAAAWGSIGLQFSAAAVNLTNISTAANGTVSRIVARSFNAPNFISTNTNVTYTNLTNAYFDAPIAGTNSVATNIWAIEANGNIFAGGYLSSAGTQKAINLTAFTAAQTMTSTNEVLRFNATSAAITQALPTAVGRQGQVYTLKKVDTSANAVTVSTTLSQTIDGVATFTLTTLNKYVTVISNGANWEIIANN